VEVLYEKDQTGSWHWIEMVGAWRVGCGMG